MFQDLLYGYMLTQCLYTIVKLGVPDYLIDSPKNVTELAKLTMTHPEALYRVMRCLAAYGAFNENEKKEFSLNEMSSQLLTNKEASLRDYLIFCSEVMYKASTCLVDTLKTGKPAFNFYFGMNFWEYLASHPNESTLFNHAMQKGFESIVSDLIEAYDFSNAETIIDVGGGNGHFVSKILLKNAAVFGVVYDLEHVIPAAQDYIQKAVLSHRCKVIAGDFFKSIPAQGSIYLLRVILHDWADDSALLILKNCRVAMQSQSKLLIVERIINNNENKTNNYLGDINMLIAVGGKERSLDEYQTLIEQAGLKITTVKNTITPFSIIECSIA